MTEGTILTPRSAESRAGTRVMLGLALAVAVVLFSTTTIADYDLWWHLNLGRSTLAARSPAPPDSFSHTFAGKPQYRGEWLGDLVIYLSYAAGGLTGVYVLKALLLLGTFLVLFGTVERCLPAERGNRLAATAVTLVLALFAIRFRLYVRPYLFSFLLLSLFLSLIHRYRRERSPRLLAALPVLEVLWANTSKGAFYGPLVLAVFLAGDLLERKRDARIAVALALTVAASLLSPETWRLYAMAAGYAAQDPALTVGEQVPLSAALLWGHGWRYTLPYQIMVLACAAYLALLRGWRNAPHLLLFLAFFAPTLRMVRMIDFFSIAAAPFVAVPVAALLDAAAARVRRLETLLPGILPYAILLLAVPAALRSGTYAFGVGVKPENVPEGACAFLDREGISGRLFNSFPFGGYIAFRTPGRRVFFDGRGGQLYDLPFQREYFEIVRSADAWRVAEERWGLDCAIVDYNLRSGGRHFPRHLAENPAWALVYWDDHSAVYLKRTPAHAESVARNEYRITRPAFNDFSYLRARLAAGRHEEALAEIERDIARNPSNQEPRLAKVFYLFNARGRAPADEMIRELRICHTLKPDIAVEHSALATLLLDRGETDEARREVARALALNPRDEGAVLVQRRLPPS